jgi:hypothetical protein
MSATTITLNSRLILIGSRGLCYTSSMEIHLNPEQEAQFAQIAAQRGLDASELAQEVVNRYLAG